MFDIRLITSAAIVDEESQCWTGRTHQSPSNSTAAILDVEHIAQVKHIRALLILQLQYWMWDRSVTCHFYPNWSNTGCRTYRTGETHQSPSISTASILLLVTYSKSVTCHFYPKWSNTGCNTGIANVLLERACIYLMLNRSDKYRELTADSCNTGVIQYVLLERACIYFMLNKYRELTAFWMQSNVTYVKHVKQMSRMHFIYTVNNT